MNLMTGETLRILVVSAEEGARDAIGEALAGGAAGDHRLYWVSQPELAPTRVDDLAPHVIVVDDALDGADPIMLISQLGARTTDSVILALVADDAFNLARQAMLAGARGFLTKPLEADDFLQTMQQFVGRQRTRHTPSQDGHRPIVDGRVLVFCAPKGGTGRTTLAINTAVSLQKSTQQSVALVDADYASPAIDVALNLHSQRNIVDLLPRLSRLDEELITGVLVPHASGVQILLAPPPADLSSPMSLPQVQQVLVRLKRMFPWVIVDLGLPLDETAFAFLDGADRIIMSVLPEMVGLRNTRLMLDQLHDRGYPDEKVWLVLNRSTLSGGIQRGDIERKLHVSVRYRIPDDQPLATHSINRGVPLVMSHGRSALGRAFQGFAKELSTSFGDTLPPTDMEDEDEQHVLSNNGLVGRLLRNFNSANA